MNTNKPNNNIIGYRDPIGASVRRRRRHLTAAVYNNRSPEMSAMNAHLRASAYGVSPMHRVHLGGGTAATSSGSLLNLMREYDNQARGNFSSEAVFFVIITGLAVVWPIAHALRVFLG